MSEEIAIKYCKKCKRPLMTFSYMLYTCCGYLDCSEYCKDVFEEIKNE